MVLVKANKVLSIIIPTINEAERLPLLLADINFYPHQFELIISDCKSSDLTELIAMIGGAKIIKNDTKSRGFQLHNGASKASGEWLLFLHADSRLENCWGWKVAQIINKEFNKAYAWFFDFKIEKTGFSWFLLELAVFIRSSIFQKPYGDQGLLISKELYFEIGGYKNIPIMEDIDISIRLSKKTKLKRIGSKLITSSRKYIRSNIFTNAIKNASLINRWKKGEQPTNLAKKYYSNQKS